MPCVHTLRVMRRGQCDARGEMFRVRWRRAKRETLPSAIAAMVCVTAVIASGMGIWSSMVGDVDDSRIYRSSSDGLISLTVRATARNTSALCEAARPDNFLKSSNRAWLALLLPLIMFAFGGLAVVTDDYFVPCLEVIVTQLHVSEDVAGATFMAAGSSAPELFTAVIGTFRTRDDVGVGTIVGSAVFNILVIIGLSAAVSVGAPSLDWRPLLRDSAFYAVSVLLLLGFVLLITPGEIHWWEGLMLMLGYVTYILFIKYGNDTYMKVTEKYMRRRRIQEQSMYNNGEQSAPAAGSLDSQNVVRPLSSSDQQLPVTSMQYSPGLSSSNESANKSEITEQNRMNSETSLVFDEVPLDIEPFETAQPAEEECETPESIFRWPTSKGGWLSLPFLFPWRVVFRFTVPDVRRRGSTKWWPLSFILSVLWIVAITFVLVECTTLAGCYIRIPSAVMGLTLLAAGTSVPDALASVAVARKGLADMAVSNAIGSNVFDILLGLGMPWLIGTIVYKEAIPVTVKPVGQVVIPIAILFFIIVLLVTILAFTGWKLSKMLGISLFTLYVVFIMYSLLDVYVFKIGNRS